MANPDLDELLNALVPFAQEMLKKHGEFYPFGGSMTTSGEIALEGAYTGDEHPPSQEVTNLLIDALRDRAKRGDLRAAAVCLDVRVTPPGQSEKTDAICVRLEHSTGEAVYVYLPYRKSWVGKYTYGSLFAAKAERAIFGSLEGVS